MGHTGGGIAGTKKPSRGGLGGGGLLFGDMLDVDNGG